MAERLLETTWVGRKGSRRVGPGDLVVYMCVCVCVVSASANTIEYHVNAMSFAHTILISVLWRCVLACPSPSSSGPSPISRSRSPTSNPDLFRELKDSNARC